MGRGAIELRHQPRHRPVSQRRKHLRGAPARVGGWSNVAVGYVLRGCSCQLPVGRGGARPRTRRRLLCWAVVVPFAGSPHRPPLLVACLAVSWFGPRVVPRLALAA